MSKKIKVSLANHSQFEFPPKCAYCGGSLAENRFGGIKNYMEKEVSASIGTRVSASTYKTSTVSNLLRIPYCEQHYSLAKKINVILNISWNLALIGGGILIFISILPFSPPIEALIFWTIPTILGALYLHKIIFWGVRKAIALIYKSFANTPESGTFSWGNKEWVLGISIYNEPQSYTVELEFSNNNIARNFKSLNRIN